jgi:hypothetical protein
MKLRKMHFYLNKKVYNRYENKTNDTNFVAVNSIIGNIFASEFLAIKLQKEVEFESFFQMWIRSGLLYFNVWPN